MGVFVGVMVMGTALAREVLSGYGVSKGELARSFAQTFANEAYDAWRVANPGAVCPANVLELAPMSGHGDAQDPYGETYEMYCDSHGLVIYSFGEDGRRGTADDIWSVRNRFDVLR